MEKVLTSPCKGMNCGCTDGFSHSLECQAEHAAAVAGGHFVKAAQPQAQGESIAEALTRQFNAAEEIAGRLMDAEEALAQHRAALEKMQEALEFYAGGSHFTMHDPDAWDTVSGEPQNFYEDENNTATVEDGSIAKAAITEAERVMKGGGV